MNEMPGNRRVIICGWFRYPRGDATANYIQYLTMALLEAGYHVEILSRINELESPQPLDNFAIHNICSTNKSRFLRRVENGKLFPLYFSKKLREFNLNADDVVIVHPSFRAMDKLLAIKKKTGFKTVCLPLEWFGREQYLSDKEYMKGEQEFQNNKEHNLLFPISTHIREQFPGTPCLVLPIMADISNVEYRDKSRGKYIFVFPAHGFMKDAIGEMLRGIVLLTDNQINKIEFHFTGIRTDSLLKYLSHDEYKKIEQSVILHSWMEYGDLIELYQKAHFLLLARETNQMTLSNFPSKVPEVMTYGVVPVVSRVGDYTKFYLEDGVNSIIFDGYNAECCAKAIERALQLPFEEYHMLSDGARQCVRDKFDYHNWTEKIKNAIEEMFYNDNEC